MDDWDEPTKVDGLAALPMRALYQAKDAYAVIGPTKIEPFWDISEASQVKVMAGLICFILWARGESGRIWVNGKEA